MKRAAAIAIVVVILAAAFAACVRDVELSRPPLPDAAFGPDSITPDADPSPPADALFTPDA